MEKKKNNVLLIVVIVLLLIIILGGVVYIVHSKKSDKQESKPTQEPTQETTQSRELHQEAGIITSEKEAAEYEKGEPTTFVTDYKREIYVTDGNQAVCYIGNSEKNYYENMYFQLFLTDETGNFSEEDEIYLSGTIPKGSRIESMELEKDLEPGNYSGVITFVVLNDDDEIVSAVNFAVDIISK
jgi:hypothetical protein